MSVRCRSLRHCLNVGRLSSLLLGAAASGMVWLRILPDCLLSNVSAWDTTRPLRMLAYTLLLGPSAEAMPVEHMFCEREGRCRYCSSPPCVRLVQLCRQVLEQSTGTLCGDTVSSRSKVAALASPALASISEASVSTTTPLSSSGDGDSKNDLGIRPLLIGLVRSLSALCGSKPALSDASHASASPNDKLPVQHVLDSTLTIVKRLYLHLAADHDHAGKVSIAASSTVLQEAERFINTQAYVASTDLSLVVLEASALWQALITSIVMLWDAIRVARCMARGCSAIHADLDLLSSLEQLVRS